MRLGPDGPPDRADASDLSRRRRRDSFGHWCPNDPLEARLRRFRPLFVRSAPTVETSAN